MIELGEFNLVNLAGKVTGRVRQISIAAFPREELDAAVELAKSRGWVLDEYLQGKDIATGWPSVWMQKPIEPAPEGAAAGAI
ncbi:hypothetical protein [Hydrogenophaga sp. OTU3427]|uniref:hypothetical protein n=1 Tax=Hydrogenophaga sp. OTU3427 TaxID=3043856 RepID=UPI00313A9266